MNKENSIDVLNNLIEISRDGVMGFRICAEYVHDPSYQMFFTDRASSCEEEVRILGDEVKKLGGSLDKVAITTGALHRLWTDFQAENTNKDDIAVLEVCERAEDIAIKAYQDALEEELPDDLRSLVAHQLEGVKRNKDRVRQLRDKVENSPS